MPLQTMLNLWSRKLVALLAVSVLVLESGAQTSGDLFDLVLDSREEVMIPNSNSWGLMATPDSAISYRRQDGEIRMWFASSVSAVLMRGANFDSLQPYPLQSGHALPVLAPSGSGFDGHYAGAGAVITAANGRDLLLFYHGESHPCGAPFPFLAGIGLARSSDGGITWQRRGQVISTAVPIPTDCNFPIWGVGSPTVYRSRDGRYLYMLFMEWFRGNPVSRPDVPYLARAPVETDGEPGSWQKYADGQFAEPGFGGLGSPVMGQPPPGGWSTVYAGLGSVSFNVALNRYLLVLQSRLGLHMATSQDGIQWGVPRLIWEVPDFSFGQAGSWVAYPSLISTEQPSQEYTGRSGYLYFARGFPGMNPPHVMSRRRFQILPRLFIRPSGASTVQIAYFACSNTQYQVQWSDLRDTNWWPAAPPMLGDATAKYVDQTIEASARKFYRVHVLP